jgi:hypothetical protein
MYYIDKTSTKNWQKGEAWGVASPNKDLFVMGNLCILSLLVLDEKFNLIIYTI